MAIKTEASNGVSKVKRVAMDPKTMGAVIAILTVVLGIESPAIRSTVGLPDRKETEADPVPVINGENEFEQGELIILDASESVGTHFSWNINPKWSETKKSFDVPPDNPLRCYVASVPGKYSITLVASNCNGNKSLIFPITVKGSSNPDPEPEPDPDPDPPPTSKYGLVEISKEKASDIELQYRNLSGNIVSLISTAISNSNIKTSNQLSSEILEKLKQTLTTKEATVAWQPWYNSIVQRLEELEVTDKIKNFQDYKSGWEEIKKGLQEL